MTRWIIHWEAALFEGLVLMLSSVLLWVLVRRVSASTRHAIASASLMALIVVSLAAHSGAQIEVPLPQGWPNHGAEQPTAGLTKEPVRRAQVAHEAPGLDPESPGRACATRSESKARQADLSGDDGSIGGQPKLLATTGAPRTERGSKESSPTVPGSRADDDRLAVSGSAPGTLKPRLRSLWDRLSIWLGVVWAVGALLMLAWSAVGQWAARRQVRRAQDLPAPGVQGRFEQLVDEVGLAAAPRLVVDPRCQVPVTWGYRRSTVVLPASHRTWHPETLDRVLLHELAHVVRRDCATRLLGQVACALHWPNPLAWWVAWNQRQDAERACDDRVLRHRPLASAYAGDLVQLVRGLHGRALRPNSAMPIVEASGFRARVRAILDSGRSRRPVRPAVAAGFCLSAACVAGGLGLFVPRVEAADAADAADVAPSNRPKPIQPAYTADGPAVEAQPASKPKKSRRTSRSSMTADGDRWTRVRSDERRTEVSWKDDESEVRIELDGDVEFSDDDRAITAVGRGSRFEMEQIDGRRRRRVALEGLASGEIERRYWVDRERRPWGREAEAWVAELLPRVFRETTVNAGPRVQRMLREGGPEQVFAAVRRIDNDHVAGHYLEQLMEHGELDSAEYRELIAIGGQLESDHQAAKVLFAVIERAGLRPEFQDRMLEAAEGIQSDHQRTRVLAALLETELSSRQIDAVLQSAKTIESDHNLGQLLLEVVQRDGISLTGRRAFVEAMETIQSDHQLGSMLRAFLDMDGLRRNELNEVLSLTRGIQSDHQVSEVLRHVIDRGQLHPDQLAALLDVARGIESDHQLAETLNRVVDAQPLDDDALLDLLDVAERIGSDHSQTSVLVQLAERYSIDGVARERYRRLAEELGSHQRDTALAALAR